jgi:hypothetical protein
MVVGGLVKVKAGTGVWTSRMKHPPVQSNEEKTSSKCVRKGLVELSAMCHGSTPPHRSAGVGGCDPDPCDGKSGAIRAGPSKTRLQLAIRPPQQYGSSLSIARGSRVAGYAILREPSPEI